MFSSFLALMERYPGAWSFIGPILLGILWAVVSGIFNNAVVIATPDFMHAEHTNAALKAATAIRVAVSHYVVRSDDAEQFLAQLRHAVGIKQ